MHFIVLGAGAIGCYVGGRLVAQGQAVTLVGRAHALQPIAAQGLRVTDLDGFDHTVPAGAPALRLAATLADAAPGADSIVLLCVKSGATESAARELAAACAPGTPVISLQNGVDNVARIQALAPGLNVLAGMVPYNVVLRGAHVHRATAGHLQLQRDTATERIAPVFAAAGLATVLPPDIRAVQWGKLLLNLNNPVNALSGLPLRAQLLDAYHRHRFAALISEALEVLATAGIRPARLTPLSWPLLVRVLRCPTPLFRVIAARMLRIDPLARSSMADDLALGRPTEIQALCGEIVRLARSVGRNAPLNADMVVRIEALAR